MEQSKTTDASGGGEPITILYTNWRGETAVRRIIPKHEDHARQPFWKGSTAWHQERQWLVTAIDVDKGESRDFALSGIRAWGQEAVDAALASAPPAPTPEAETFQPKIETCPKCGAKGAAFICDTEGCPVNGGAAYPWTPAPTPEAGSDLARLRERTSTFSTEHDRKVISDRVGSDDETLARVVTDADLLHACLTTEPSKIILPALVEAVRKAIAALSPPPSPPPSEDLAGQGEPVAWAYEYEASDGWQRALWWVDPSKISDGRKRVSRNIRPLYAAPAPSRPADREEIAATIRRHIRLEWYGHDHAEIHPRSVTNATDAILAYLALRDAPRDGGDGWLPIETAPKDGTLIGVGGGCAIWNDNGGFWHTAVGRDYGRRIQWKVTHWKNLDPATIPPSPNAGDETQDTQGGGR